jgi:ribosomal protein S18 acetylase RimI-like enzyme
MVDKMMAVVTKTFDSSSAGCLRPFDIRRDLRRVADLVEQCFADTLDPDGQQYLGQMRAAASNPGYLRWAGAAAERISLPLSGYVWEEDNQIVGNLNLIPFNPRGHRYYLIANVAVRPDYRRRGIARSMTVKAIEHAQRRGADSVWLHVREDNMAAIRLYQSLGFGERARRSAWHNQLLPSGSGETPGGQPSEPKIRISKRQAAHWPYQLAWLNQTYPPELTWHLSLNLQMLSPGWWGGLRRLITDTHVWQRSAFQGNKLVGVLACQSTPTYADALWLAVRHGAEDLVVPALLSYAQRQFGPRRPLALDYPAGRAVQAIQEAGFQLQQTLIWMEIGFNVKSKI